jgi:heme-degrading monooxygenase HmoA
MELAKTPKSTYYAVIFTSIKNPENLKSYQEISDRMVDLVNQQDGFLGFDSAQSEVGITVSYWRDVESIKNWKGNMEHIEAQKLGREKFYRSFNVRIAKVEREYSF